MTPCLLSFALICIALSIGIWRRQTWAWYAGWLVFLLFAVQVAALIVFVFSSAQTTRTAVLGYTGIAGIVAFWTPIALWWKQRRKDFGKPRAQWKTSAS